LEFYQYLWRILRHGRIDVCFSHMLPLFSVLAAPVLKAQGIPLVTWYAHPSLTWILRLAHHVSDRMVSSVATAYPYKPDKLTVVGQGINPTLFAPDDTELDTPPLVLCAGRLSPVKNHTTLLHAAALLRERWRSPFRVVIVGGPAGPHDEPYVRALCAQIQQFGLQDVVHLEPPVPMMVLPSWYRRCTVAVNLTPSGFGDKVAWEAMSCGRPCVVANEGFRETLGRYADSLLFRYEDATDLAGKLQMLLTLSEYARAQMGLYLRQQVVRMHGLDRLVSNLLQVFQAAMKTHKNGRSRLRDRTRRTVTVPDTL
jgi:glycosyltransferase involved in cell wall biosynthesis